MERSNARRRFLWTFDRAIGVALSTSATVVPCRRRKGPLVSVIIATYNRPANLILAIQSVLNQRYETFEVLVVGDACTDDSGELVRSITDPRVTWLSLETNSGSQSMPNNLGLASAQGKYVAYLGHDDLWLPTHLSKLVNAMERHSLDIATTRCFSIGPEGSNALFLSPPNARRISGVQGPPSAVCHRRDLVERSGNWIDYRELPPEVPPDSEFINRAALAATSARALRDITVLKFNAAWRVNSYLKSDSSEQMRWLQRSRQPIRAVLPLTWELIQIWVRRPQIHLPTNDLRLAPGEHRVDAWRRVKGLQPRQ